MEYKCPRCNFDTNNKYYFIKHIHKKILCKPINGNISLKDLQDTYILNECNKCSKKFSSTYKLNKHLRDECNDNIVPISPIIDNNEQKDNLKVLSDIIYSDHKLLHEELSKNEELRKELKESIKEIDILKKTVSTLEERLDKALILVSNNNQTNNNKTQINNAENVTINNHITIKAFGFESVNVGREDMTEYMMNGYDGLADYVVKKHFDPKYPENRNIQVMENHLKILYAKEAEKFLKYPKIYNREPYNSDKVWLQVDKDKGICDGIIPQIEKSYSTLYKNYDDRISYLDTESFIENIVGKLKWTLGVKRWSLYEYDQDPGTLSEVQERLVEFTKVIANKLHHAINV